LNKVLLIEDDLQMQKLIINYLNNFDFEVTAFLDPIKAISNLETTNFDIAVVDLMLPNMDGFDVCKKIKKIKDIPIIISSARGDIGNKIMGYEVGADDYLAKPYEPRELVLRINAVLKRANKNSVKKIGDLYIDEINRVVKVNDYEVEFTKIEFEIFMLLVKNRNKAISREQIIYSTSLDINTKNRTIDMHISNIRYKIGDDPKNPKYIKSVWGIGYKLV